MTWGIRRYRLSSGERVHWWDERDDEGGRFWVSRCGDLSTSQEPERYGPDDPTCVRCEEEIAREVGDRR